MSGYFACPPAAWAIAAEHLPKPWPEEAIIADLRWWEDAIRLGRRMPGERDVRHHMPGEQTLATRWGVSERQARRWKSERHRWADPRFVDVPVPSAASKGGRREESERGAGVAASEQERCLTVVLPERVGAVEAPISSASAVSAERSRGIAAVTPKRERGVSRARDLRARPQGTAHSAHPQGEGCGQDYEAESQPSPLMSRKSDSFAEDSSAPNPATWIERVQSSPEAAAILEAWRGAWQSLRGAVPLPASRDPERAAVLAEWLAREGYAVVAAPAQAALRAVFTTYLVAQAEGRAWPQDTRAPSLGHAIREIPMDDLRWAIDSAYLDLVEAEQLPAGQARSGAP